MCGSVRYHDAETTLPANRAVSSELHRASIPVVTQTLYSTDLDPSDLWLFPTLKMGLKRKSFANMEGIKSNVTTELPRNPKEVFRWCFQQWQDRWKCARVLLWR